jgi:hypothetical protein
MPRQKQVVPDYKKVKIACGVHKNNVSRHRFPDDRRRKELHGTSEFYSYPHSLYRMNPLFLIVP